MLKLTNFPPHSVTVLSGKGGVGKTTVSANLALSLGKAGKKVLLIDGDFSLGKLHVVLNVPVKGTFSDFLSGEKGLHEIVVKAADGVELLPAASGIASLATLSHVARDRLIREVKRLFASCDYLIVDAPAGIPKQTIGFALATHETICVCNPEPMSLTDAYAVFKLMKKLNPKIDFKFLMNRVRGKGEYLENIYRLYSTAKQQMKTDIETLGYLPEYDHIRDGTLPKQFKNHPKEEAFYVKLAETLEYLLKRAPEIDARKEQHRARTERATRIID